MIGFVWVPSAALAGPALVAPLGMERLDRIAELRFTVELATEEPCTWVWSPPTGLVTRITGPTAVSFDLGHPTDDAERAADQQFLRDTFWLAPQLHVQWAADGDAILVDRGPEAVGGRPARRIELRYTAGGYTPGDAHDLYTDADGRILAWSYRSAGSSAPSPTVSFEEYVTVGPLALATVRRAPDGAVAARFRDLEVVPVGIAVSVAPDPFLWVTAGGCQLGPGRVAQRPRATTVPQSGSRTRALAEADREPLVFDGAMSLRDGASLAVSHRWSAGALALEDAAWLTTSGIQDCDFRALDVAELRTLVDGAGPAERGAVLTVLLEWTLSEVTLPAGIVRRVRGAARSCAATGRCDALYGWVARRG